VQLLTIKYYFLGKEGRKPKIGEIMAHGQHTTDIVAGKSDETSGFPIKYWNSGKH
jgi:hypothetical protein